MPRPMPAGLTSIYKRRGGFAPVWLVDVQLPNGVIYYIASHTGVYPTRLGAGPTAAYKPWLRSCGPFRTTRSLRTDAGDLTIQNISGNTIYSDTVAALRNEWEGALIIVRRWKRELDATTWEMHGFATEPRLGREYITVRMLQLMDPSDVDGLPETYQESCSWRFKSAQCGSMGTAATCPKTAAACADPTRNARPRFNGLSKPPVVKNAPPYLPPRKLYYSDDPRFQGEVY